MATDEMSNLDPTSSPFKAKYPDNFPSASPNTQARRVAKIVEQNHPEAVIREAIKVLKNHDFLRVSAEFGGRSGAAKPGPEHTRPQTGKTYRAAI